MSKKIKETAEFDYGYDNPTELKTYRIRPNGFKSKSQGTVRYTGNYGDNAMTDEAKMNEGDDVSLIERLHAMLNKANVGDDEIVGGVTLTPKGIQKVAARLGIAGSEVGMMINSLVSKLRREREVSEGIEQFSHEDDWLGNVTVRDNASGKEKFVRGSEGTKLSKKLKKSTDDQAVLRKAVSEADGNDWITKMWNKEAKKNGGEEEPTPSPIGTYNFDWQVAGQSGTGTARFRAVGQRTRIDVLSVRDQSGKEFEPDVKTMQSIEQQAYDKIQGGAY